jgi:hypothetical protein
MAKEDALKLVQTYKRWRKDERHEQICNRTEEKFKEICGKWGHQIPSGLGIKWAYDPKIGTVSTLKVEFGNLVLVDSGNSTPDFSLYSTEDGKIHFNKPLLRLSKENSIDALLDFLEKRLTQSC